MNKRKIQLALFDTLLIGTIYGIMAFLYSWDVNSIRLNGEFTFLKLAFLTLCIMGLRTASGTYSRVWRYASISIYLMMIVSDTAAGLLFFLVGRYFEPLNLGFGYSALTVMSIIIATLGSRFVYQFLYSYTHRLSDNESKFFAHHDKKHKINVAIVGAGNIGSTLARELIRNPKAHYNPYCFIETDKSLVGNRLHGVKIYEENEDVIDKIKSMPVQEIVIALPDADAELKTKLFNFYKQTDCKVKLYDYPLGKDEKDSAKRTLREFRIEDLLFRDALSINNEATSDYYRDKTILITGGGGSIGSELCRQIAQLSPKKLVILDIYENNAYEIQQELIRKYGDKLNLDTIIASVRDVKRLEEVFSAVKPDIVFHAAAHKHVPLMERSACEAIKNNVIGTYNTANMAEKYGVKKFLLISTDKAVNPTNIMGASKRLCEMVIQCRTNSKTEFTAVRFGNVLGSNGSVIPLFKRQIEAGGPITLTDKRIVRYFMTIPEAVQLVLETGAMARNGELFVLDMGKPVKILDLAENMIRLSGLKPYKDIDIVEIGLRPGEKLYEELLMKNEKLSKTSNEMIFIEHDEPLTRNEIDDKLDILLHAVDTGGNNEILDAIISTVPTYCNPDEINSKSAEAAEMNMVLNAESVLA